MKTQRQIFYSEQAKIAERNSFVDWLMKLENKPTAEELELLRRNNPQICSLAEKFN